MFKTKKSKLTLLAMGLVLSTSVIGSIALSSCTSSSTNPYGPYTKLDLVINGTITNTFRYQTSNTELSYYNTSSDFGTQNQNRYLSKNTIKSHYYELAKTRVKDSLNATNWTAIKNLYGASASNVTLDSYQASNSYKNNQPSFFYGTTPTSQMINVANIYNKLNIMGSIFQYASNLSNELLTYLACDGIGALSDSKITDIADLTNNINNSGTTTRNQFALQLLAGNGISFGVGNDIYQLWPSGFSASINAVNPITNPNQNVDGAVMEANKTQLGDINAPYNLANYSSSNSDTNKPKTSSYKINVSNLKITYQWYKTDRSGGNYVDSFNLVNSATTSDQKSGLSKLGIDSGQVNSLAYTLPISDLQFDLVPETYSYQDPFYSGIYDTVTTGLYDVKAPMLLNSNNKIDYANNTYPNGMKTTIGTSTTVNWRGIVATSKNNLNENNLPSGVYDTIRDKNLNSLPYYQPNLAYAIDSSVVPYQVNSNGVNLSPYNTTQLLNIFKDPFNKKSSTLYYNQPVYNNVNNLNKQTYLNIWSLGWLVENSTNTKPVNESDAYKNMKSNLDKSGVTNVLLANKTFTTGKTTLYKLINLANTTNSGGYKFSDNGITNLSK